jgi:hypothetical protein
MAPELSGLCTRMGVGEAGRRLLLELVATYGEIGSVISSLKNLCMGPAMECACRRLEGVYGY